MCAVGAALTALAPGHCRIELSFSPGVGQQRGFFHGGIIRALADTAGGYAALTLLSLGSEVLTLEYKGNFLRPAEGERLVAERTVLRAGRSVSVTRVDVHVLAGDQQTLRAALQQSLMRADGRGEFGTRPRQSSSRLARPFMFRKGSSTEHQYAAGWVIFSRTRVREIIPNASSRYPVSLFDR